MRKLIAGLILLIVIILHIAPSAYAADVVINGKLLDKSGNPISMGSVAFVDSQNKTVAATSTDSNGAYSVVIPQGAYTIEATGPKGSTTEKMTLKDQQFNESTNHEITLNVSGVSSLTNSIPWMRIGIGALVLIIILVVGILILRRRNSPSTVV